MRHISILSLIIVIVVISGCINQNQPATSTKDGIIITDFSFDRNPIYAKDNVELRLEVQNVGGNKAELKKIQVYGVDFTNDVSNERDWRIKGNKPQTLDENFIKNNLPSKGELFQPDPDIKFEGAKDFYEWGLQAPGTVTSETNYNLRVRVEYNYNTTYTGVIRIIDENYLESLKEEDRQKLFNTGGIVSSELTNGPISVIPFSGRHFVVSDMNKRTMKFKIENVGKGYPYICQTGLNCVYDGTNSEKYSVRIKEPITGDIISCDEPPLPTIKLSSGESSIIYCTFDPTKLGNFTNKVDKSFQIIFEYSYYVDGSTSIVVKPAY